MLKNRVLFLQKIRDKFFLIVTDNIKKISNYHTRLQIHNEFYKIGQLASDIDIRLAARFNIPIAPMKEEEASLDQKLKNLNETLNEKIFMFQTRKKEFDLLISELNEKKKRLKSNADKIQSEIKNNQKKLKTQLSLKKKGAKEYTLLTMFKDKSNNEVLDLTNVLNKKLAEGEDLKEELRLLETRHLGAASEWESLAKSLNEDMKSLQKEAKSISDKKNRVNNKMQSLYPDLGFRIDKENAYPESLIPNKQKVQALKSKLQ